MLDTVTYIRAAWQLWKAEQMIRDCESFVDSRHWSQLKKRSRHGKELYETVEIRS
jgi:hypothetical protein